MGSLPTLRNQFVKLVESLKEADESKHNTVVLLLQDMLEVVTCDMMVNEIRELVELGHGSKDSGTQLFEKATDSKPAIAFPPPVAAQWEEQVFLYQTDDHSLKEAFSGGGGYNRNFGDADAGNDRD